jgi:hypothetical protein
VVVIEGDEPEFIGMIRKEDLPIVMGIISFLLIYWINEIPTWFW